MQILIIVVLSAVSTYTHHGNVIILVVFYFYMFGFHHNTQYLMYADSRVISIVHITYWISVMCHTWCLSGNVECNRFKLALRSITPILSNSYHFYRSLYSYVL